MLHEQDDLTVLVSQTHLDILTMAHRLILKWNTVIRILMNNNSGKDQYNYHS